jgi:hypothetical protein
MRPIAAAKMADFCRCRAITKPEKIMLLLHRAAAVLGVAACAFATTAAAETIVVTKPDCQRLVQYVPSGDVEYQPGVDAYGRPVAPADVGGGYGEIKPPDEITFPIQVNLRNFQRGPEADAQASSAAVTAATKSANAAAIASIAASTAETAANNDPGNEALAAAAAQTRAAATAATSAVTAGDKSAAAADAANAAAAASALAPSDNDLAVAAQDIARASQDASQANDALNQEFRKAERIGQYLGQPVVGNVTIRGNQVYFNNRPLMDPEQAQLAEACQKILKQKK